MSVRLAKTQKSQGIRPVWSESSLSTWRKFGSLATHWAYGEDSDQTEWISRLIWVFAGRTLTLLVLSCRGQIFDKATSVKTVYKQSSGTDIQAMSLPKPYVIIFRTKPVNCLRRYSFDCKSIPSCNCPGEKRKFQSIRACIRTVILKGVGSGTPIPSTSLRQIHILVHSDQIISIFYSCEVQTNISVSKVTVWHYEAL